MKNIFKIILLVLIFGVTAEAQPLTWQRVLNYTHNSTLYKAQQTSDGGYIAIGEDRIGIYQKIFLVKFNEFGDTLWTIYFDLNVNLDFRGNWVEETIDRGFIVCGSGDADAYLIKTDSMGNIKWSKTFGGSGTDAGYCVKQTNDNGFILAIRTSSFGSTIDFMLVKTDSLGNQIWSKVYAKSNSNDYVTEVKIIGSSGYILVGAKSVIGDSAKVYVMRTNIIGDTLWTKNYGGQRASAGYSIDLTEKNGFIICGVSNSFNPDFYFQSYIAKIDSLGNLIWERCYSSNYFETAYSIKNINNNEYVFCGTSDSVKGYYERAFIRKIDINGNVITEKFFRGGDDSNKFNSVDLTNDNGYVLCGYATFNPSGIYSYIAKTDSMGNISTKIEINHSLVVNDFKLFQNYPNPFNSSTIVVYEIYNPGFVNIELYDVMGRKISDIINKYHSSGNYKILLDVNEFKLSSGLYYLRISINEKSRPVGFLSEIKKLIYLK